MKTYYRPEPSPSSKLWEPYIQFDIDLYYHGSLINFNDYKNLNLLSHVEVNKITDGFPPDFSSVGTDFLLISARIINKEDFRFCGVSPIPVKIIDSSLEYFLLFFEKKLIVSLLIIQSTRRGLKIPP